MYLQFSSNNGGCFQPYLSLTVESQLLPEVHGPKTKGEDLLTTLLKNSIKSPTYKRLGRQGGIDQKNSVWVPLGLRPTSLLRNISLSSGCLDPLAVYVFSAYFSLRHSHYLNACNRPVKHLKGYKLNALTQNKVPYLESIYS